MRSVCFAVALTCLGGVAADAQRSAPSPSPIEERLDHAGAARARIDRICAAGRDSTSALVARRKALRSAIGSVAAPDSLWREDACVLSLLYVDPPPRDDAAKDDGIPAVDAWLHLLHTHPTDAQALDALAALTFDLGATAGVFGLQPRFWPIAHASYAAVRTGSRSPIVFRLCSEMALVLSDAAGARYCEQVALDAGVDSSWHLIRRTWLDLLGDGRSRGFGEFDAAIAAAHDSGSLGEVAWHIRRMVTGAPPAPGDVVRGLARRDGVERLAWVHHLVAPSDDSALDAYHDIVWRAEAPITGHGALFAACPVAVVHNGSPVAAPVQCTRPIAGAPRSVWGEAQIAQLWNVATGARRAILTYAFERQSAQIDPRSDPPMAAVQIALRTWQWHRTVESDTSFTVRVPVPNVLPSPYYIAGAAWIPAARDDYTWSMVASQSRWLTALSDDGIAALPDSGDALSDLVIGDPSQHVTCIVGRDTVALAPLNVVNAGQPADLYFQFRNAGADRDAETHIVLARVNGGVVDSIPALSMTLPLRAVHGINAVQEEMRVTQLGRHDFRLGVAVTAKNGTVLAARSGLLLIR